MYVKVSEGPLLSIVCPDAIHIVNCPLVLGSDKELRADRDDCGSWLTGICEFHTGEFLQILCRKLVESPARAGICLYVVFSC